VADWLERRRRRRKQNCRGSGQEALAERAERDEAVAEFVKGRQDLLLGFDQLSDGSGDILDGHFRIDSVLVEQIDAVDAEAPQRIVHGLPDVFGCAVDRSRASGRRRNRTSLR